MSVALSLPQFKLKAQTSIIIDVRPSSDFTLSFIPKSIFLNIESDITNIIQLINSTNSHVLIVATQQAGKQSAEKLISKGLENIVGYLDNGFEAWLAAKETIDMVIDIEPDELAMDISFDNNIDLVDVRQIDEYNEQHIKDAINVQLEQLFDEEVISEFKDDNTIYLYSQTGNRSVTAASLFKKQGIHNLRNIIGGFNECSTYDKLNFETTK